MQRNAWCDEVVMLWWLENVYGPAKCATVGVLPAVLLLDRVSAHCAASVRKKAAEFQTVL